MGCASISHFAAHVGLSSNPVTSPCGGRQLVSTTAWGGPADLQLRARLWKARHLLGAKSDSQPPIEMRMNKSTNLDDAGTFPRQPGLPSRSGLCRRNWRALDTAFNLRPFCSSAFPIPMDRSSSGYRFPLCACGLRGPFQSPRGKLPSRRPTGWRPEENI
jgi:hypothetical protein